MPKCWCCARPPLLEKFAFRRLNRRQLSVIFLETAWRVASRCYQVIPSFMLARIPKRTISALLLLAACITFAACANHKPPPAPGDDPDTKKQSQIPWDKPELRGTPGQLAKMA